MKFTLSVKSFHVAGDAAHIWPDPPRLAFGTHFAGHAASLFRGKRVQLIHHGC